MEIFCDFDGTISNKDLLDIIVKELYGIDKIYQLEKELLENKTDHNSQLKNTFNDLSCTFEDFVKIIDKNLPNCIDEHFKLFYEKCLFNDVKFYIISAGFKSLIYHYLPYVNKNNIFSNDVIFQNGISKVKLYSDKLDKRKIVSNIRNPNKKTIYIGDGISDFDTINIADTLYVKKGSILENHCLKNNVIYKTFSNFSDLFHIFNIQDNIKLLSPGIVRCNQLVLNELKYQHTFMHRDLCFKHLHKGISDKVKSVVCTNNNNYTTMLVTGSGTTSMDEVINCLVGHKNTLFVSNGMFGERWINIANFYNDKNTYEIKYKWGSKLDIENIINFIEKNNISYLVLVHCDTSVGILNDIEMFGKRLKNYSCKLIVDAVSSFGVVPINMEEYNIDILVTNPNKSIASHMGLGIIIVNNEFMNNIEESKCCSYSLNLKRHFVLASKYETCNSVSISSMNALNTALHYNYGSLSKIKKMYKNYKTNFNFVYDNLVSMNKKILLSKEISSPSIITVLQEKSNDLITKLKNKNFVVYPCKGHLNDKGYQISFYGDDCNKKNLEKLLNSIESLS